MQKAKGAATNATLAHGPCGRGPCGPRLQLSDPVKPTSHEKKTCRQVDGKLNLSRMHFKAGRKFMKGQNFNSSLRAA